MFTLIVYVRACIIVFFKSNRVITFVEPRKRLFGTRCMIVLISYQCAYKTTTFIVI